MKKPLKVALYSGLLFPGIGHFMLKNYIRAIILFSSFAISSYIYFTDAMTKVSDILQQVQNGKVALDTTAIAAALNNISTGLNHQQLNLLGYFMLLIWLISIIDSYRSAKKLPPEKTAES